MRTASTPVSPSQPTLTGSRPLLSPAIPPDQMGSSLCPLPGEAPHPPGPVSGPTGYRLPAPTPPAPGSPEKGRGRPEQSQHICEMTRAGSNQTPGPASST